MTEAVEEIKTLLSSNMESTDVKTFYQGEIDFDLVPKSYLPAAMIFGTNTDHNAHGTAKDQSIYSITIRVVLDVKAYFSESGTGDTIKAQEALQDIMEERDANGVPLETTVLGILRRNIRGTNFLFSNRMNISYSKMRTGEFFYVSADLTMTATTDLVSRS